MHQSLDVREKLAQLFPRVPDYKADLASGYSNFGVLLYSSTTYPTGNTITGMNLHHASYAGLKIEKGLNTTVSSCHIHHNTGNGINDGDTIGTIIENSEIDNNGGFGNHGVYLNGFEGTFRGNKVHNNEWYGVHLWGAPRGSAG